MSCIIMPKRVLVTGFQPFLDFKSNPSKKVAEALNNEVEGDAEIFGRVLPVSYKQTESALVKYIEDVQPDLIIGLGLAPGRSVISLEKIAANYKYSPSPDNEGNIATGGRIDESQPDGMFSLLDVEGLNKLLGDQAIPSEISMTAGAYLCNYAMFVIIRESKKRGIKGGFVHIPCDTELAVSHKERSYPSMTIEMLVNAVRRAVNHELGQDARKASPVSQ